MTIVDEHGNTAAELRKAGDAEWAKGHKGLARSFHDRAAALEALEKAKPLEEGIVGTFGHSDVGTGSRHVGPKEYCRGCGTMIMPGTACYVPWCKSREAVVATTHEAAVTVVGTIWTEVVPRNEVVALVRLVLRDMHACARTRKLAEAMRDRWKITEAELDQEPTGCLWCGATRAGDSHLCGPCLTRNAPP